MLLTLHVWRVIIFLYAGRHCLLPNSADMHQKPSACVSLHVDTVPIAYQWYTNQRGRKTKITQRANPPTHTDITA
jgi:hypothetical protein